MRDFRSSIDRWMVWVCLPFRREMDLHPPHLFEKMAVVVQQFLEFSCPVADASSGLGCSASTLSSWIVISHGVSSCRHTNPHCAREPSRQSSFGQIREISCGGWWAVKQPPAAEGTCIWLGDDYHDDDFGGFGSGACFLPHDKTTTRLSPRARQRRKRRV